MSGDCLGKIIYSNDRFYIENRGTKLPFVFLGCKLEYVPAEQQDVSIAEDGSAAVLHMEGRISKAMPGIAAGLSDSTTFN